MRIAIFSDTFSPQINGVARVAQDSAEVLSNMGHEVVVVTASQIQKPIFNSQKFKIIHCPSLPVVAYPGERFAFPFSLFAYRELKKFKPDIIHSHTPFGIGWKSVIVTKMIGAKLIGTHHTFFDKYLGHIKADFNWAKGLSWRYVVKFYNYCDLILSPSQSLADQLVEYGLNKPIAVITNPIDTDHFEPLKNKVLGENIKLIYIGRVSYEKSIDTTVKAFGQALKENSQLHLTIVGDGPERKKLETLAHSLGINDKIEFTGFLKGQELLNQLQSADIFISASKSENLPISYLEAMAVGLPIIAVAERGVPEIVKPSINGFLAKADDEDAMAGYIVSLSKDRELMNTMGSASRELALNYSRTKFGRMLEKYYIDTLNTNK